MKSNPRRRGPAAILDIDESVATLKFQSQTFKVARYCVRRKVEEKDLPQGPAECDNPMNLGWDMPQPLFAPPSQPDPLATEAAPSDSHSAALSVDGAEKPLEEATGEAGVSDFAEIQDKASGRDDPVPVSLDSDGPVHDMSQSDESRTHLYERTYGDAVTANMSGNRESPES